MRRPLAAVFLAVLLAGCSSATPPATTSTTPPVGPTTEFALIAIDGRWDFDAAAALDLVGVEEAGLVWLGEARVGSVAGQVLAMDATAARQLGATAPAPGEVHVNAGNASGPIVLEAAAWPAPRVTAAFEMERVRPCQASSPATLCSMEPEPDGTSRLRLDVPEGAAELRFHADVLELTRLDYPASWDGVFQSPAGESIPFHTGARSRTDTDPPGRIQGNVTPGLWTIAFDLVLNGSQAPGAIAGFITYRTPGFSAYDLELLKQPTGELQTRAALAQPGVGSVTLVRRDAGALPLGALALISKEDARALYGIAEGNVTGIVVKNVAGLDERVRELASGAREPALRALRAHPLRDIAPAPAAGLGWARPDEATTLAARPVPGGQMRLNGVTLPSATALLALPLGPAPWRAVEGGHWNDTESTRAGIAEAPHLVAVSADVARAAGLDPKNVQYAKLEVDAALGPRTLFVMAAVEDGPPGTVWASAALVAFIGKPVGGRVVSAGVPLVG